MSARLQLEAYLDRALRRLQWILSARGAALAALALLLVTLVAAPLLRRHGFADSAALAGRIALAVAVAGVVAWFVWRRHALRQGEGAAALERALPDQSGRVATYLQERARPAGSSPLIDLLAEDALTHAEAAPLAAVIPVRRIALPAVGAVVALALLVGLLAMKGPWSEGARQLWLGKVPLAASVAAAAGGIAVKPGDATVRRNQDLPIEALVAGSADDVQVHVRFDHGGEWEVTPMQANAAGGGYAFTLYAVRDAAHYYVTAGRLKSAEHRIEVVDLPTVEKLRLTYDYPGWTGLPQRLEESGGDISAVAGTRVGVEVVTSTPLTGPLLVIDGDDTSLSQDGTTSRGSLAVKKAGHYRIATRFGDEVVPLTPDYAIDLVADEAPDVHIERPGKDYRATSIEEVPVTVEARDDFRLEALELHYSVNGGDWRSDKLPAGSPDVQAAALLRLEELQQKGPNGEAPLLVPGDLVSYYALAKDHSHSVQTDLFLIQIQPFEQRYTQSQAGGGGGGGGGGDDDQDGEISKRQKDVLLATWNLQRNQQQGDREAERTADNARMLSEVQQTLAAQAHTLVERAQARQLTGGDDAVNTFVKSMEEAAKSMEPAAKNLSDVKLEDAVKYEQLALQQLLRAESTFRDIQVAMRNQRGGGGGGGSQAGRDVSEMTELELDLEKNQYETEQQTVAGQRSAQQDELMRRLAELARRQEQMAREAARQQQAPEAQRWQQEQLRREAEELQRQLQQLAQQQSQRGGSQRNGSQQQGGQQSGSQQSASSQGGSQSGSQRSASAAAEAAQQVAQALDQMRQGGSQNQQRASEQLNRAREQLERGQQQADRQRFGNLADEAGQLADRQRESERELRAAIGNRPPASLANPNNDRTSGMTYEQMDRMAATKRQLQSDLESLQQRIEGTRRQSEQKSPRAAGQLAEARKELEDLDTVGSLGRSARDIERGRGVQAATREQTISDTLGRLQQNLEAAADTAASESGGNQQGRKASPDDLLAELGDLRRALDRAREQALAQNQSGNAEAGARAPDAAEGRRGQAGGQQGEQGQGGQGQRGGQSGEQSGQQGGTNGGDAGGGIGDRGAFGIAGNRSGGGGGGRWIGGPVRGSGALTQLSEADRAALREQARLTAERLAQMRGSLADSGTFTQPDMQALLELEKRLQRGGADPMAGEYPQMTALVNQLELAALKAQQGRESSPPTRAGETIDDSRRYRDNVAEYYRRLGGGND